MSDQKTYDSERTTDMGELLLSGGGDAGQTAIINTFFASIIEKDKPMLYIPVAGDPRFRSYESCLEYVKAVFSPLGIREVTIWTNIDSKNLTDLSIFSAIYMSGGSAEKLHVVIFIVYIKRAVIGKMSVFDSHKTQRYCCCHL